MRTLRVVAVSAAVAACGWVAPTADAGVVLCGADPGFGDGRVRVPGAPYAGNDVHNCDGAGQSVFATRSPGEKATFDVRVRNDADVTRNLRIGTNSDLPGLNIKYFLNGKNVTERVVVDLPGDKAGLRFKNVAPGQSSPALRIVAKVKAGASPGFHELALNSFIGLDFLHADIPYAIVSVPI